jgi:hypothetical protein
VFVKSDIRPELNGFGNVLISGNEIDGDTPALEKHVSNKSSGFRMFLFSFLLEQFEGMRGVGFDVSAVKIILCLDKAA